MNRNQKEQAVSEVRDKFSKATIAVLTDYKGLDVESITELRRNLRQENVEYKVVKNTLAKIAVKGTPAEALENEFEGPIGVAFGYDDPTAPPRVLVKFAKKQKEFALKAASFSGAMISLDKIKALAELPSKEQLLGQIAGLFAAPVQNFMNCLVGVPRNFLNCLVALKGQKEKEGN